SGWSSCPGALTPQTETCNGIDDNCNGVADDGTLPGVGAACYTKGLGCTFAGGNWTCLGTCATGTQSCSAGSLVCNDDVGPTQEVCDGLDNDCNGQTDDSLPPRPCYPDATPGCNVATSTCVGLCRLGASTCNGLSGWGACTGAVTPVPELCDGKDNDCNGTADDGSMAGVGDVCYDAPTGCTLSGGLWTCIGECRTGTRQCVTGNLACVGYQGPVAEICDVAGQDSDCDGFPSNGFDLQTDVKNCGTCGNDCTNLTQHPEMANATPRCDTGACARTCKPSYWDNDGNYFNGCEYYCVYGGIEVCDGVDNDCNGKIDAADPGMIVPPPFCRTLGACAGSTVHCLPNNTTPLAETGDNGNQLSSWVIQGATLANTNAGVLYVTITYSSPTRTVKLFKAATLQPADLVAQGSLDADGTVTLGAQSGSGLSGSVTITYVQADADITLTMCSTHQCTPYTPTPLGETGDDQNQLSNWVIQGADDINTDAGVVYVAITFSSPTRTVSLYREPTMLPADLVAQGSLTSNGTITLAAANGSGLQGSVDINYAAPDSDITYAVTITTWVCDYPATVDVVGLNEIAAQESRCDNVDNNCDGSIDEIFFLAHANNSHCEQDGSWGPVVYGTCRGYGRWLCEGCTDPTDPASCTGTGDSAVCDMACGAPTCKAQTAPGTETCDGTDEDCNGLVDDAIAAGATNDMRHVVAAGFDFYIDTYEASRPDALVGSGGALEHRSCSKVGVMPWQSVTHVDAAAACAGGGKRLCTEQEWHQACAGPSNRTYPYGNAFDADACNGWDYDPDCAGGNDNYALPTGSAYGCPLPHTPDTCVSEDGVYDMSGNLREWTATQVVTAPPAFRIRGGGYDNISLALTCDFAFLSADATYYHPDLGFRCCAPCAPPYYLCANTTACVDNSVCGTGFCDTPLDGAGLRHCAACVDIKTSNSNCGGCGIVCGGGTTCQNGVCKV
ncbi:MAG: SUMF1/EgtB/PvdO family nonheme iron enzyme, partial [Deltaproteobacteria bacterium]|nr:SUMF1/EgtB/PvdO family nonheme iron enzyme [Deltaproteobacteria bacterium]